MKKDTFTDVEKKIIEALWEKYIPMPDIDQQKGGKAEEKE